MAFRATFGGVLAGAQRWSIGISFTTTPAPGGVDSVGMTALANNLFTAFNTNAWSTTASGSAQLKSIASSSANLDKVRTYYYPGSATVAAVVGESTQTSIPGTGGRTQPAQSAIVCSLLTGLAGRSNRGRVYLPNGTTPTDANGTFSTSLAAPIAQSLANFLSAIRTASAFGGTIVPIVDSSTGADYPITVVRCDNVTDTQRRRRDKITPTVTAAVSLIVG